MTFRILILLLIGFSLSNQLFAQQKKNAEESLYNDVAFLSHDSLEGREMGTRGELIAANYIANRYSEIGLTPFGDSSSYFQVFSKQLRDNPHSDTPSGKTISGRNVIGLLDKQAQGTIIIGAHYDHLGWGDEGSLSTERAIHNGADDNASGVAALLFLAKELASKTLNHNVIFIAFTGEEKGLLGSHFFADASLKDSNVVSFMINMDMVGRLDSLRRLAIYGVGTSPSFVKSIQRPLRPSFQFVLDSSGMGPSDHTSFYLNDIPVLHFFTGQHEQYHKPEDDLEYINFEGLKDVSVFIKKLVLNLDKKEDLVFTKTKDPKENKSRRFKVTLGVIPDYLFDGEGLKIDGVKEGRTADEAGIKRGDIIVKMGEFEVHSIYDYMDALEQYESETTVQVIVLRDEEELKLQVTFQ